MCLSLQGKQLTVCVTGDESWAFKQNLNFKKCVCTSFLMFKDIPDKIGGDIKYMAFGII